MGIFLKTYIRELKLITSDIGIILFLAFLPLAYPIIYSLIYNPELVRDVKMVVVDNDRTAMSRELTRNLDATQEVRIIGYAPDMGEAKKAMHSHDCFGILEIPEGFSRKVGRGESSPAVIYSDMSLLLRYRGFLVAATNVAQEMGAELMAEKLGEKIPLAETLVTGDPMGVENVSLGNLESGFDSFIMPGVLILILQQCLVLAVGMSGGAKREKPWKFSHGSHQERRGSSFDAWRRARLSHHHIPAHDLYPALCAADVLFPHGGQPLGDNALHSSDGDSCDRPGPLLPGTLQGARDSVCIVGGHLRGIPLPFRSDMAPLRDV